MDGAFTGEKIFDCLEEGQIFTGHSHASVQAILNTAMLWNRFGTLIAAILSSTLHRSFKRDGEPGILFAWLIRKR